MLKVVPYWLRLPTLDIGTPLRQVSSRGDQHVFTEPTACTRERRTEGPRAIVQVRGDLRERTGALRGYL